MSLPRDDVKSFIINQVTAMAESACVAAPAITEDTDLLASGLIDSLGYIDLVAAIEAHFSCQVDFYSDFAGNLTTLGGLVNAVVATQGDVAV